MFNQVGVQQDSEISLAPALPQPLFTLTNHQNWVVNCIKPIHGPIQFELINPNGIKCIADIVALQNLPLDIQSILKQSENQNIQLLVDYLKKINPNEITISDATDGKRIISFQEGGINKIGTFLSTVQIGGGALMVGTGMLAPVGFMLIGSGGNCFIYSYNTKEKDFTVKKYLSEAATGFVTNGILGNVSALVNGAGLAIRATAQLVASVSTNTIASTASEYFNTGILPSTEKLKAVVKLGSINGVLGTAVDEGFKAVLGPTATMSCKTGWDIFQKTFIGTAKAGITKVATNVGEIAMGQKEDLFDGVGGAMFVGGFVNASIGTVESVKFHQNYLYQLKIEQEQAQIDTQKALVEAEEMQQMLLEEEGRLQKAQGTAKQKLESITNENQQTLQEKQELLTQLDSLNSDIEQNQNAIKQQQHSIAELQKNYIKLKLELTNIQTQHKEIAKELSRLQQVRAKQAAYITEKIDFYHKKHFHAKINGQTVKDPGTIKNAFLNGEKVSFKKHGDSSTYKLDSKFVEQLTLAEKTQNAQKQRLEGQLQQKTIKVTSTEALLRDQKNNINNKMQQEELFKGQQNQREIKIIELETKIQPLPEVDFSGDLEHLQLIKERHDHAVSTLSSAKAFEINLKSPLHLPETNCDPLPINLLPLKPSRRLLMGIFGPEPTFEIADCDSDELFKHIVLVQGINDQIYEYGFYNDELKTKFCINEPDQEKLPFSPDYHNLRSLMAFVGVVSSNGEVGHHLNFEKRELEVGLINQPTVHWCWNKLVEANTGGNWENSLSAVLEPYMEFESKEIGKPFNLAPYDTFTFGTHRLSKNSIILVREDMIPDQLKNSFESHYKCFAGKFIFYSKHKTLREAVIETLENHYPDVWHICDQDGKLNGKENKYSDGGYRKITCIRTNDGKIIQLLRGQNTKFGKALDVKGRMVELHDAATKTVLRFDDLRDKYFSMLGGFRRSLNDKDKKIKLDTFETFDVRKDNSKTSNPMFAGKVKQSKNLMGMGSLHCIEVCVRLREYDPATGCHVYADYLIKQAILADLVSLFYEKYPNRSADELSRFDYKLILQSQLVTCTNLLEQILNKLNVDSESDMQEALDLFNQYATLLEEAIQKCENAKEVVNKALSAENNIQASKNPAFLMIGEEDWKHVAKPDQIEFDIGKNWPLTNELNLYKDKVLSALPYKQEQLVFLYHTLTPSDKDLSKENSNSIPYFKEKAGKISDKEIAQYLWLNSEVLISDDMVEKVNAAAIYLNEQGFQLMGIKADGDCFCNAFLKSYGAQSQKIPILDIEKNKISYLREIIAKQYEVNQKNSENSQMNRVQEIKKDGEWLTAMGEGDLLASNLGVPIRIVTVNKDSDGCGIIDMLTFAEKDKAGQKWKKIKESEKPKDYIFIVDLGGHFVYSQDLYKEERGRFLGSQNKESNNEFQTRYENNKGNYQRNVVRGLIYAVMQERYFKKQYEAPSPTVFLNKLQKHPYVEFQDLISEVDKTSTWINHIFNTISNPNSTSSQILEALSKKELLKECYSKFEGVNEGYTIGQHTRMVINVAQKYRSSLSYRVQYLVNWDEFVLFLALHDIGKGVIREQNIVNKAHKMSSRASELKKSGEILASTMGDLNILPEKIKIFTALLMYNPIEDYLQFDIDSNKAAKEIFEMANNAECHPFEFYHLYQTFYLLNAASYPNLKEIFILNDESIRFPEAYEMMMQELKKVFQGLVCEADNTFIWNNHVFNIINNSHSTSSHILEALSKNDRLQECYSKPAGVAEGYTVSQHTQMVLDVAQKYRNSLVNNVESLISWDEFILFLALHDIGKGVAKEAFIPGNAQGLSFKQLELKYCREILESTMKDLNVLPAKIKVFKAMLMDDFLGDYLQFDIDLETANLKVVAMAEAANCPLLQFYHLFRIFHLVDAASYPSLKIFFTFKEDMLGYSEAYESMIGQLTMSIKN